MNLPLDFTVVIPTYNGAERLTIVIDKLRSQVVPEALRWEIIIVDNNSQDQTASVVEALQVEWSSSVPLRYVFEGQQGLAYARQCGINHARGELIGFLDDDNWPYPSWVAEAVIFAQEKTTAGAFGGRIKAAFEFTPDDSVKPLLRFLAIRDKGDIAQKFQPSKMQLPPGAGLVVRKTAWVESIPSKLVNISRAGDDYELSLRMDKHGWEIWYNPLMVIDHFIPAARLERDYLLKLAHRYGLCTCYLLTVKTPLWQQPVILFKSFIGSLKRVIIHYFQYHLKRNISLESDCQLAFHWGNLKSPFAYLGDLSRTVIQPH